MTRPRAQGRVSDGSGLRKRQPGFTQMSNATAQDKRLSARARGVLVFLLSLPVDWKLRQPWLVAQFPEGRVAVMGAVRELRRRGHYRVERRRRLDGTFTTGVSVSDEANAEWASQHAGACKAQGTDRPKWDVTVRLLADGRVEDEPASTPPPPPDDTESDETVTIHRKQETGHRKTGHRSTGHRSTGDRSTRHQYEEGDTDTQQDEREISSPQGDARERGASRQRREAATTGAGKAEFDRVRQELATRPKHPPAASRSSTPSPAQPVVDQPEAQPVVDQVDEQPLVPAGAPQ